MPRVISLAARTAFNAQQTGDDGIVLAIIRHDDLDAPLRFSTHPTERLSDDPLRYGTRHQGNEYNFALMSAVVPDDRDNAPPAAQVVFENVDSDIVAVVRSVRSPARIDLRLVLASNPDVIEEEWRGLDVVRINYDANRITLDLSRSPVTAEPWPADRMTLARFRGLGR